MAAIELDINRWPVAVTRPPQDLITDQELADYFKLYYDLTERRGGAYVTTIDLRGSPGITPTQRRQITEYMRSIEGRPKARCVGTALVFDSAMLRGVLTAIFWVKQPAYEIKVFKELDEAVDWGMHKVLDYERELRTGT